MHDDEAPWTGDGVTKDAEEVSMGDAKCASRAQEKEGRVPSDDDVMRAAKALANGRPAYHFVKRLFDIVFSAAVLVVLSPVWAVVAIAVKVDVVASVMASLNKHGWGVLRGQYSGAHVLVPDVIA